MYPPNTYWPFLMMVTVFGLWSQLVWKVLTAQPCVEARWHSNHCELFPTAGDKKCERLPRKFMLPANIVGLIDMPKKKQFGSSKLIQRQNKQTNKECIRYLLQEASPLDYALFVGHFAVGFQEMHIIIIIIIIIIINE